MAEMSLSHDADVSLVSPKRGGGTSVNASASETLRHLQAKAAARSGAVPTLPEDPGNNGAGRDSRSPEGGGGGGTAIPAVMAKGTESTSIVDEVATPATPAASGAGVPVVGGGSSEISASDDEDGSWIAWFCSLRGNEFFCEVEEDYIQDDFNLTGLNSLVPYYDYALDMVLDVEMPMEDSLTEEQQEIVESAAVRFFRIVFPMSVT